MTRYYTQDSRAGGGGVGVGVGVGAKEWILELLIKFNSSMDK